ncbi:MAG: tetratricopeptide repeat protein [Verrucomicrobiota bacterium JB023]|nr:tetratricopeptide repeat protein [Verrucomicrobiota bacterium JB023]
MILQFPSDRLKNGLSESHEVWISEISAGNRFFEGNDMEAAKRDYLRARELAVRMIRAKAVCRSLTIPAEAIHVLTCANLGNACLEMGDEDLAENYFQEALDWAHEGAEEFESFSPTEEQEGRTGTQRRKALINYLDFCQRTKRVPKLEKLENRAIEQGKKICPQS